MNTAEAWLQLLPRMRWFAGKGRQLTHIRVRPQDWEIEPGNWPAVRFELIEVTYADGDQETYRAMSAYRPVEQAIQECTLAVVKLPEHGELAMSDVPADMAAMAAYIAHDHGAFHPGVGKLWHHPRPVSVDQSNSSVRIATNGVFKLYRRVDGGSDREGELLSRLMFCPASARLYGSFHTFEETCYATVLEYIDAVGDGWQLANAACAAGTDFADLAAELGRALRSVHTELARAGRGSDPSLVAGAEVAQAMTAHLEEVAAQSPEIAAMVDQLRPAFAALVGLEIPVQQIHGDFHLGQVLYRKDPSGWVLIDFEGEPDSPADQRNRPDSPWRDVASALRSFGYVRRSQTDPDSPQTAAWHDHACQAFLDGYCDGDTVPTELLRAYHLDRGAYEVRYELRHRPGQAHIPLGSFQNLPTDITGESPVNKEQ